MGVVRFVFENGRAFIGVGIAILVLLERFATWWPVRRRTVVMVVTVLLNTTMMVGLTFATLSVLLAAPVLAGKTRKPPPRYQEP